MAYMEGSLSMRALLGAVLGLICVAEFSADGFAQTAPADKPGRRVLTLQELTKPIDIKYAADKGCTS